MTLGEWLETWLSLYIDPSELAQSTKACYHRAAISLPTALASHDLSDLNALDLMPWLVSVAKEHPRAAQLDRVMLSKALRVAKKLGLCPRCVIDHETLPKTAHRPKKAQILTIAEAQVYILAAKSSPLYPLLALCLCGLRRGEALGVRWSVLENGYLMIRRQRLRVNRAYQTLPLKTEHSNRGILLPFALRRELEAWPRSITGWLCDATPEQLHREHKRVLQAAGLPNVTLHGLRHTFATAAAVQGQPMKHLQMALGHSKVKLTADLYADHLSPLSDLPATVWQDVAL